MRRDKIIELLKAHYEELTKRFGMKSLAIFGSAARDESGPDSDVDILVDFAQPPTFDQYMDLKFFLEDLLGRRVDLVTRRGLRDRIRPQVEKEALYVA
jgi:uncharacterized protein